MKFITGGLSLFFLLVLIYLHFRLWLDARRERIAPHEITGETLPEELKEDALRPLRQLNAYYEKRDTEQADACIDETMLSEELLILGTNPVEIFHGREGAKRLLQGDWKYWGELELNVELTTFSRAGSALYFVTRGQIKLDIWRFRIPIKITGILENRDNIWHISKLQFINDLNTNYMIIAWVPALALTATILLFGLSCLLSIF